MSRATGTDLVGIGIRITTATRTFREMETSTVRSAGVSIRPSLWVLLRLVFTGITIITSVPTGITGVAATITMPTSTMASIMVEISDMAATNMPEISMLVKDSMAAKGFMVAKGFMAVTKVGSMAGVAEDSMEAGGSA